MGLNIRDYYSSISFFGMYMCYHGFYRLSVDPRYEMVGGVQIIIGVFLMLFGLTFLLLGARNELGAIEKTLDKVVKRLLCES